jgi:hypothetical protein
MPLEASIRSPWSIFGTDRAEVRKKTECVLLQLNGRGAAVGSTFGVSGTNATAAMNGGQVARVVPTSRTAFAWVRRIPVEYPQPFLCAPALRWRACPRRSGEQGSNASSLGTLSERTTGGPAFMPTVPRFDSRQRSKARCGCAVILAFYTWFCERPRFRARSTVRLPQIRKEADE